VNIKVNKQDKPIGGTVDASGSLVYVAEEGAFYLSDPLVKGLSIQGVPAKYTDKISALVEEALVNFYSSRPVYKLKTSHMKQAAVKMGLKSVVVQGKALVVTFGI